MLRSIPFHPNMNLSLSFSIFTHPGDGRVFDTVNTLETYNAYQTDRIYRWDFCSYNFHTFRFSSFRFSGKGEVDVYRMCMCFIVSIPCHTSLSMRHDAWGWCIQGQILSYTPQFDTISRNKGLNVRLGERRWINDYVKYVTINRMCRSITIF